MTPHDLPAWCLHSPSRLAVVLTTVVGLGACGLVLLPDTADRADPSATHARVQAAPVSRPDPAPASSVAGERPSDWSDVRAAAAAFLAAYLTGPNAREPARSHTRLQDHVTPSLWRGLRLTDPASYPSGPVTAMDPDVLGAFAAEVRVVLDDGPQLELTLVQQNGGWLVADVQPYENSP